MAQESLGSGTKSMTNKKERQCCKDERTAQKKLTREDARVQLSQRVKALRAERGLGSASDRSIIETDRSTKFTHFNRYRFADEVDYMTTGIAYVFMTKPHLNLVYNENTSNIKDNFLALMSSSSTEQAKLIRSNLNANSPDNLVRSKFMPIITSSAESFETKDNLLKTRETGETFVGNKIIYGDVQTESLNADTFSIEYTEYSDASLLLLHKTWVDYIHAVKVNKISPARYENVSEVTLYGTLFNGQNDSEYGNDYVMSRTLDYVSSVYYFLLDPDGTTIRYWCKYTGVFPTSVPYSAMSFNLGDSNKLKKLNITYQYSYKNDMDPYTLEEFAYLTSERNTNTKGYEDRMDEFKKLESRHDPIRNNTWRTHVSISEDRRKLIFTEKL